MFVELAHVPTHLVQLDPVARAVGAADADIRRIEEFDAEFSARIEPLLDVVIDDLPQQIPVRSFPVDLPASVPESAAHPAELVQERRVVFQTLHWHLDARAIQGVENRGLVSRDQVVPEVLEATLLREEEGGVRGDPVHRPLGALTLALVQPH